VQIQPPEEDDKLTEINGVLIGINYSAQQSLRFDATTNKDKARPDALLSDISNQVTAIIETKLDDGLYQEQLHRHFANWFKSGTATLDKVFTEVSWTRIAEFLNLVARQSSSEKEKYFATEFVQYLDLLGVVDFWGFQTTDFVHEQLNENKLNKFMSKLTNVVGVRLGLKPYEGDWKLYFPDVPNENVWFELSADGINFGIVLGSGKFWRAQALRNYILRHPAEFRQILEQLRCNINRTYQIWLRIHANFRHSRFRTGWLGDIRGIKTFPDEFDQFIEVLSDESINAFRQMPKVEIQERFKEEIRSSPQTRLDEQGRFPHWPDIDSFLQYTYFHIDVHIPSSALIGESFDTLCQLFEPILSAQHQLMRNLSKH
jgi:hypothetical protein